MKKIFGMIFISLLIFNTALKAQVTAEAIAHDPQSGPHNYFGVKVTLSQTYDQNVTVTGYIFDEGNAPTTDHPFSLTVPTGELTAETATNFYETDPTASATVQINSIIFIYAGVSVTYEANNNILKFSSFADVNTVVDQLDADFESYNDNYESQYSSLTADQLDSVDIVTGFDEFTSLKNFEVLFSGYSSKRSQIETTENTWLSNDLSGTDPDDIDFTFDDAENTVFNNSYQLKIGLTIYEMRSTGLYNLTTGNIAVVSYPKDEAVFNNFGYSFPLYGFESSEAKKTGPFNNLIGVESAQYGFAPVKYDICVTNARDSKRYDYGSNRKFKLKVAVNYSGLRSSAKGKVVSLKKKNNHWNRNRYDMAVGCAGNIYDANAVGGCTLFEILDRRKPSTGFSKKKSIKTVKRHSLPVKFSTQTNEFHSFYKLPDGTTNSLIVF